MSQKKAQLLNPINGNINVTGVITATSFVGSGEGLTGVASTDNIQTATEATFLSGVKIAGVTTASGGVVGNVTGNATGLSGSPNIVVGSITASSGSVSGNLSIGGTLTYQDVTNMDVLGIGTFQQGVQVLANGLDITGFSTFKTGVSVTGVLTATSFVGDGSGLTGVGVGTEDSINTSGIITASAISANEFIGTGDKLIFSPSATSFSPTDGATDQDVGTNINVTFDQPVYAGVGSIFLRNSSGIGTEIAAIGIASTSVSFSNQTLTIDPPASLPLDTDVYVVLPSQSIQNAVGGFIATISNYNFSTLAFAYTAVSPADGASSVASNTNITITFTDVPSKGTGTIELRSGSAGGTLIESFDAASASEISISGNDWILNPSVNNGNLYGQDGAIFLVIPDNAINNFSGVNVVGGALTYSFTPVSVALGNPYGGGFLICASGGVRWVVAPTSTQQSNNWYNRNIAATCAQQVTGCTGWFIPSCGQLQNPGHRCRTHWDSYVNNGNYWSDTQNGSGIAWKVRFDANGTTNAHGDPSQNMCLRAFRCVTY